MDDRRAANARDRNVAVLLAGGMGSRIGLGVPKQLIKIAGRSILEHTLAAVHSHPMVDEVLILMAPGHLDAVRAIVRDGGYSKVAAILEGAETRNETTWRALEWLGDRECKMLLHDAVRPLVTARIIRDCYTALDTYDAVDVVIPSADTIVEAADDGTIRDIPPRDRLRRGQTPQAFRSSVLRRAYELAWADGGPGATDDCTVVLRHLPDVPIAMVEGDERNLKVTDPIDVYLADKLFQLTSHDHARALPEAALRRSLQGKVVVVFGGSYGIGADVAALADELGAKTYVFSRSGTDTHVERRADVEAAARSVIEASGRIDHVVVTAAVLPRGDLSEVSEEEIYHATEVNYLAPVFISQLFHPHLRATRGSLLLFTSSSYTRGRAGYSLYSSAKAAIVNLTQALADEWAADGVRVNCINPERTATPMRERAFGLEPSASLLDSAVVARESLETVVSALTGQIIEVRKLDPLHARAGAGADCSPPPRQVTTGAAASTRGSAVGALQTFIESSPP